MDDDAMAAALSRARQALELGSGVEVNTRVRLLAMLQALLNKCREYHTLVDSLRAELSSLQGDASHYTKGIPCPKPVPAATQ